MADKVGHAAHSRYAGIDSLPGVMPRRIVITMLGAGSGFTPTLMRDVLCIPTADEGEIRLCDIDESRLGMMEKIITKVIAAANKPKWTVKASKNRRDLLKGTDYIVNCIEVSGLACVRHDNDIPAKYGVDQCIGDTIGPGGLFKGLRTIPVWLDILRDIREMCPEALVLNYTNPMSMMCLAGGRAVPEVKAVGLCHSVQGTLQRLSERAGVPRLEIEFECAGINHLAWFTKLRHQGKDLYPMLKEQAVLDIAGKPPRPEDYRDLVRKDIMLHFGAFITESSGHLSEYLPYYRKRKDIMARFCRDGYHGESSFYANGWPQWRKSADETREKMMRGEVPLPEMERTWEYAGWIIEAREKDQPWRIHGNVMNVDPITKAGPLISNLMHDGCVEVACMVDRNGITPTVYGKLPPQMAALCDWDMRMFDLAAQAAIEKSKEAAIHALMLDPLTAAVCSPEEIKKMTLELFEAEAEFLPGYR